MLARSTLPVGIAAALSGLYPIATMLLARFVAGEALPRLGLVAVALAAIGIVLISLGLTALQQGQPPPVDDSGIVPDMRSLP